MAALWLDMGGFMFSPNLSDVLRNAVQPLCKFRQFCDVKDTSQQKLHRGDTFHWNTYGNVATPGGALVEGVAIPKTTFPVVQGTLTITEYANAAEYSGKLDNLSYHPVKEIIDRALMNDCRKVLDTAAYAQFNRTVLNVVPAGGNHASDIVLTQNGVPAFKNDIALTADHVVNIVDGVMKERNIPAYVGEDYVAIGRPTSFSRLKKELQNLKQYTETGYGMILSGEIGRYAGCRFVEQTNIDKKNWSNGKSDEIFFLGDDCVAEAAVIPEEMRGAIPGDFGRLMGVCWYYLGGFGIVHLDPAQSRIVKWASVE